MSEPKPPKITEKDLTALVQGFGIPPTAERKAKIMAAVRAKEVEKSAVKPPAKKLDRGRGREIDR